MKENVVDMGRRYVSEGRLIVRALDESAGTVEANCRGDGVIWSLGRDERGWWCFCPAMGRCAHLYTLGLVCAIVPREAER